jgi:hypothetical protein
VFFLGSEWGIQEELAWRMGSLAYRASVPVKKTLLHPATLVHCLYQRTVLIGGFGKRVAQPETGQR